MLASQVLLDKTPPATDLVAFDLSSAGQAAKIYEGLVALQQMIETNHHEVIDRVDVIVLSTHRAEHFLFAVREQDGAFAVADVKTSECQFAV